MKEALKQFGLNDNEIKVYKACLELGSSSVTKIAQRANIYRTLTYEVLKSLTEKGLVSSVIKDKKKYFEAASPRKFIQILKEKEKLIKEILPNMLAIQETVKTKPSITLYEGKEGIKTVLENVLLEAKELLALTPKKAMLNLMQYYFPNFVERRVLAKIKIKLIVDEMPLTQKLLEYRILKKTFSTGYWIHNNKVIFISFPENNPLAIVIENDDLVKTMQITFMSLWDSLQKSS
ncbi:MAG: helix-turn-helix domain-containing protein [Candidatus Woesearchaeota archaeon]